MTSPHDHARRADRLLDAAAELLLRLGYRKVTVEDIANRAGVGKGTVYLHWRTKEILFQALLLREMVAVSDALLEVLETDPEVIRPHRFLRESFVLTQKTPLLRAVLTRDAQLLGSLSHTALHGQELIVHQHFYDLLIQRGLFRDDIPNLHYALSCTATGHYLIDTVDPDLALDIEAQADALAHTVRAAFEPSTVPDRSVLVATSAEITTVLRDLLASYRQWIYAHDPATPS